MLLSAKLFAADADASGRCSASEFWDDSMSMCMQRADQRSAGLALAGQFNAFAVFSTLHGPRGVSRFAAPNMFMLDAGSGIGSRQLVNLDLMGTTEVWTYPRHGYPELLQIGEERADGKSYIDAQHPHSSPLMGLTLSDMVNWGDDDSFRFSFAPRGESTDGPIAFMHRLSSRDDPDAPLGHHVGQDVGHISSTVLALRLNVGRWSLESSAFNGTEPSPTVVNLPLGRLNSVAMRVGYRFNPADRIMASAARVEQTDPLYPGTTSAYRLSASLYEHLLSPQLGTIDHSFVIGSITRRPTGASLISYLDEVIVAGERSDFWGRVEVLQRLRSELQIPSQPASDPSIADDDKRWVTALTAGYTFWTRLRSGLSAGVGSSLTVDALPGAWADAYGGRFPLTVRMILQLRGYGRWQQ